MKDGSGSGPGHQSLFVQSNALWIREGSQPTLGIHSTYSEVVNMARHELGKERSYD